MPDYKTGERLRSKVSSVQFVVVRADAGLDDVLCEGVPLAREGEDIGTAVNTADDLPKVQIGKRYEDEASSIELLCVSAGTGRLTLGSNPLQIKVPKPLPASD
ncbi:hypothetical protein HQO38_18450 [Rhodococcus fascians]|nr:hypothetical protein [Rhodococcus fascians]MBY4140921.1 hypothetical protein [Rhodococcus fascians]MBY4219585.1 hypothetical protein [Rhodococcus fascians]MBY4221894.1 hypothetical protein [Rhodococcus fascians]MBY4233895.1 hypothetical protein [Rhodococcus fascians]